MILSVHLSQGIGELGSKLKQFYSEVSPMVFWGGVLTIVALVLGGGAEKTLLPP